MSGVAALMSDQQRPASVPGSRRDLLISNPVFGTYYGNLRERHHAYTVDDGKQWMKGHHSQICRSCRTTWPCDVGVALSVINFLLIDA